MLVASLSSGQNELSSHAPASVLLALLVFSRSSGGRGRGDSFLADESQTVLLLFPFSKVFPRILFAFCLSPPWCLQVYVHPILIVKLWLARVAEQSRSFSSLSLFLSAVLPSASSCRTDRPGVSLGLSPCFRLLFAGVPLFSFIDLLRRGPSPLFLFRPVFCLWSR